LKQTFTSAVEKHDSDCEKWQYLLKILVDGWVGGYKRKFKDYETTTKSCFMGKLRKGECVFT
jgi:hypothetical protein